MLGAYVHTLASTSRMWTNVHLASLVSISIGSGKMMVEFFSAEIWQNNVNVGEEN